MPNAQVDPVSYTPRYYWDNRPMTMDPYNTEYTPQEKALFTSIKSIIDKPVNKLDKIKHPSIFSDESDAGRKRIPSYISTGNSSDEETMRERVLNAINRKLNPVPGYNYNLPESKIPTEDTIMVRPQMAPAPIAIKTRLMG